MHTTPTHPSLLVILCEVLAVLSVIGIVLSWLLTALTQTLAIAITATLGGIPGALLFFALARIVQTIERLEVEQSAALAHLDTIQWYSEQNAKQNMPQP